MVDLVYLSARLMSFLDTRSHFICKYFKMKMMHLICTHEYHNYIGNCKCITVPGQYNNCLVFLQAPDPDSSVSDKDNQVYLGFLKNLDSVLHKQKLQPGRDLTFYLHALRVHAR